MLIDSHAHIWRPVSPGTTPISTIVSCDADISVELVHKVLDLHGVDRAVLVQPVFPGEDNSYVADAAAREPEKFAAVCVVDPRKPDAVERLEYWVTERGCRGLRLRPKVAGEERSFGDPATFPIWEAAERLGIAVNILGTFDHLGAVAKMANLFPNVPIVIDHLAHPPMPITVDEMQPLLSLSSIPNVYAKLSGFYYYSATEYPHADCIELVRAVYDGFGPGRLLWGSDFPHVMLRTRYGRALRMIEDVFTWFTVADRQQLMGENALRLYWPRLYQPEAQAEGI